MKKLNTSSLFIIFTAIFYCCSGQDKGNKNFIESVEERLLDVEENRRKVGKIIDQRVAEVKPNLPYDFKNGIIFQDVINEYDINQVFVYSVSDEGVDIVLNYISKNQLIQDSKAADAYKLAVKHGINSVYSYYHNNELLKEIRIEPQDY